MTQAKISNLSAREIFERQQKQPELCLIDVREPNEWQEARISGAIHIPKGQLANQIKQAMPEKKQAIYLHCRGGVRSVQAAEILADLGYQELYSMEGGIIAWVNHGFPIEQG